MVAATPTTGKLRKLTKREPLNFGIPDGSTDFPSRLAATQDFIYQSPELGELDPWQENTSAWEEYVAWHTDEVLRQQKIAGREKKAEQQMKNVERTHRGY